MTDAERLAKLQAAADRARERRLRAKAREEERDEGQEPRSRHALPGVWKR